MSEFLQGMLNKTKKFANEAMDDTKDAAQKAKLNSKINNEKQQIDKNMMEIGKYFYQQVKDNPPKDLEQFVNNIKVLNESIEMSRREIQALEESKAARKNNNA